MTKEEVENGSNNAAETNAEGATAPAPPLSPFRLFFNRLTWRRLFADEVLEARILTVVLD